MHLIDIFQMACTGCFCVPIHNFNRCRIINNLNLFNLLLHVPNLIYHQSFLGLTLLSLTSVTSKEYEEAQYFLQNVIHFTLGLQFAKQLVPPVRNQPLSVSIRTINTPKQSYWICLMWCVWYSRCFLSFVLQDWALLMDLQV